MNLYLIRLPLFNWATLATIPLIILSAVLTAQPIFQENFDNYEMGDPLAETLGLPWSTWSGSPLEDVMLSHATAYSGNISARFMSTDISGGPGDIILRLGDQNSGTYHVNWKMYIPSGYGGYFNVQHSEIPGAGSWAVEVVFRANGTLEFSPNVTNSSTIYSKDQWLDVLLEFNLDNFEASLIIDDIEVAQWATNVNAQGEPAISQLGGINFYTAAGGDLALYWVDDVVFSQPPSCPEGLGNGVVNIASLPYYSQDRTTCGAGDDLNSVNTISCGNVDGEEEVFVFTPTVSDNYHIEVNGSTHSGRISLFIGCPLLGQGGECVGSATTSGLSPDMLLSANLEAGQTYYLVISRSNCFTYDISIDIPATCPDGLGNGVVNITSLPYYSQDRTTCGAGDDLNSANTINCGNVDGEEEVFIFTPTVSDNYHIEVNGFTHSGRLSLFSGCPLLEQGGVCVGSTSPSGLGHDMLLSANLESGQTYFLVISRSNCFTYDISIDIPATCPDGLGNAVVNITSLPYYSQDRTTCGAGDDLNSANTINCGNVDGEEEVFIFTPTVSGNYHIEVNGSTHSGRLSLFSGCPLLEQGGECVGSTTTSGLSPDMILSTNLESGETYYLVISRSNCFTYDISIDIPLTCPSGLGADVVNIPSLPYYTTARTTCNLGNDLNNANTISCGSLNSTEEIFIFSSAVTGNYHIEVNASTASSSIVLYKGCPLLGEGGECVAEETSGSNILLDVLLEAGATYYLIISGGSSGCVSNYDLSIDIPGTCPSGLGASVETIVSLPYETENRSTCGTGNDLNNANTDSCGTSNRFNGEDETFIFSPEVSEDYYIQLNNVSSSSSSITLYQGCPLLGQGGTCIASATSGSNLMLVEPLMQNETYYLVVSSTSSACYDYDLRIDYGPRPVLTFVSEPLFNNNHGVSPQSGRPNATHPESVFEYRVTYSHPDGLPPMDGYPVVGIDMNGDGNLNDIVQLNELDMSDQDFVNGKEYFFVRGFEPNEDLHYSFMAYDEHGNFAIGEAVDLLPGPLVFVDSLDLHLYANDISFSTQNPAVGETVEITARIHNESLFTGTNVPVAFYANDELLESVLIPEVISGEFVDVSVAHSFPESGYKHIKVVIDESHTLEEENTLNNTASRPLPVGNVGLPGTVLIDLNATNFSACPESHFTWSGTATYSQELGTDVVAAGAMVIVKIEETNEVFVGYTNSNGHFSISVSAPTTLGTFTIQTEITDFSITGSSSGFTGTVVECPPSDPHEGGGGSGGSSHWNEPGGIDVPTDYDHTVTYPTYKADLAVYSHFIAPSSLTPDVGESITISTSLENVGNLPADDFYVRILVDGVLLGDPIFVSKLYHGHSKSVEATTSISWPVPGFHVVEIQLDMEQNVPEYTEDNNIATRAIVVGNTFDLAFLQEDSLSISEEFPAIGEEVEITAAIHHVGVIDATAEMHFSLISGLDTTLIEAVPFSINQMDTLYHTISWMATHAQGHILAEIKNVDPLESNALNNTATIPFGNFVDDFDCGTPQTLVPVTYPAENPIVGNLSGATSSGIPVCDGAVGPDAYFSFNVTAENHFWVNVNPFGGFDAVIQVLDECGGNVLACVNSAGAGEIESAFLQNLLPGDYIVRVHNVSGDTEAAYNGNFLINLQSFPTAKVQDNPTNFLYACDQVDFQLEDFVGATPQPGQLSGILDYEWLVAEQGGTSQFIWQRGEPNYSSRLDWLNMEYNKTYNVYVRIQLNVPGVGPVWGVHQVDGPDPNSIGAQECTISTSSNVTLTELLPAYQGTNVDGNPYLLCDFAIAFNVLSSENYRWRFDVDLDSNNGNEIIYTRGSGNPSVRLSWVDGLLPGVPYNVAVEVRVDGQWSGYGNVHQIVLSGVPNVAVRNQNCGGTYAPNGFILSESVCEADFYRFRFTPQFAGATRQKTTGSYPLNMGTINPPLAPGTYNVQVQVQQNGVLGDYSPSVVGDACEITISGPTMPGDEPVAQRAETTGNATLFPNPNAGSEVRMELDGLADGNHEVMIQIYDVYGKLIQTDGFGHEGYSLNRLLRFSNVLSTGMYMVNISVDRKRVSAEKLIVE